jgi:hypothetical protein
VLTLIDLVDFGVQRVETLPLEGELVFEDVEPYVRAWRDTPGGLLWSLEERRGGTTVARTLGR